MLKIVLAAALAGAIAWLAATNAYRLGGEYILRDSDHAEVMVAAPASAPGKTLRVLFVGNSLTFVNDLPAMLVNIAAADPGNRTRLEVKAETYPNARLSDLMDKGEALAWTRSHHVDVVVLQEHSGWYEEGNPFEIAVSDTSKWVNALRVLNETPVLFEVWSDGEGSDTYTNQSYNTFGSTPDEDAQRASLRTRDLGRRLGLSIVPVGTVFQQARHSQSAPELLGPDHHHPSVAGTYLAALVFYRAFTGRSGAESFYRPWGLSKTDTALLARINAE